MTVLGTKNRVLTGHLWWRNFLTFLLVVLCGLSHTLRRPPRHEPYLASIKRKENWNIIKISPLNGKNLYEIFPFCMRTPKVVLDQNLAPLLWIVPNMVVGWTFQTRGRSSDVGVTERVSFSHPYSLQSVHSRTQTNPNPPPQTKQNLLPS